MARQGWRLLLEQSDMRLAMNMPKTNNGGYLCAVLVDTQFQMKNPHNEVREQKKWGVDVPGQTKM